MNDVKSFEQTVQCAKVSPINAIIFVIIILNYVLCEPSHAWDLVQFSP